VGGGSPIQLPTLPILIESANKPTIDTQAQALEEQAAKIDPDTS
jgi:hypothetical protein